MKNKDPDNSGSLYIPLHGEFDLVLNRHASFNADEVARILAASVTFLTQRIHGRWAQDLLAAFEAEPQWPDATPEKYIPKLRAAGLSILTHKNGQGDYLLPMSVRLFLT